jgi:glycosyltransferase involved in cell wall biosynthesis
MSRALAAPGRLPVDPPENVERRADYQALCDGLHAAGPRGTLVFAVSGVDLEEQDGDVHLAAGLGLALVDLGYGVRLLPRDRWHATESCDVFIALAPDLDPSCAPPGAWKVAWVLAEVERWADSSALTAYDQVVAASTLALRRLARETPRARGVLPAGVDTELFTAPDSENSRLPAAVTTVPWSAPLRDAHRALVDLPNDADVAAYLTRHGRAPDGLVRWCRPGISYFATPELYRRSAIFIDDTDRTALGYGILEHRFFEAAAGGALPVVNGLLGVRQLGLRGVSGYRNGAELDTVLRELRADPAALRDRSEHLRETVRLEHSWSRRARSLVDLLRDGQAAQAPRAPSRVVHMFPDYHENPYQRLLYSGLGEIDACYVAVDNLAVHLQRRIEHADPGCLHVHWTAPVLQWAGGPFRAKQILDRVTSLLGQFKERGGRLIWTVHNILPHDVRYSWAEVQLAQLLADTADLVHVMSERTVAEAEPYYRLYPERLLVVPHSSYTGWYPDWVTREAARQRLGIGSDEKVLIALGGIRPYKGLDRLLDVFEELVVDDPAHRLLVAGKPGREEGIDALVERCRVTPGVIGRYEFLPDDQLQVWMKAADLAVLPYQAILNSGAFQLAQTFGVPVVAPARGALADEAHAAHVMLFDADVAGSLHRTLRTAVDAFVDDTPGAARARASARAVGEGFTPQDMALQFARAIDPVLGRPARTER